MDEKIVLYGLSGLSLVIAAILMIYRSHLLSRLNDRQIDAIFGTGQPTEIELSAVEKTVVKLKTRYPALVFLVPAMLFAILASQIEQTRVGKQEWTIKGRFVTPGQNTEQPGDWSQGVLTIHPTDIKKKEVGTDGGFEIKVTIPVGKTFEDAYEFIEYASFDKRFTTPLFPSEQLEKFQAGEESLLTNVGATARFYGDIPVKVVPLTTSEGGGQN